MQIFQKWQFSFVHFILFSLCGLMQKPFCLYRTVYQLIKSSFSYVKTGHHNVTCALQILLKWSLCYQLNICRSQHLKKINFLYKIWNNLQVFFWSLNTGASPEFYIKTGFFKIEVQTFKYESKTYTRQQEHNDKYIYMCYIFSTNYLKRDSFSLVAPFGQSFPIVVFIINNSHNWMLTPEPHTYTFCSWISGQ